MIEENISQESGFENIDKARNYFVKEISKMNCWAIRRSIWP